MRLYFSTVNRNAPAEHGGELFALDWSAKRILANVPIAATNPTLDDPNPRGNTRGGRGIAIVGDEVVVCSYHTLRVFDLDLRPRRDLTNGLMVGLHEVHPTPRGTLWVTSTAIDAALEIDLKSGAIVNQYWPREQKGLQDALGLAPGSVDKRADNRGLHLGTKKKKHESHLHLNAVATRGGETFALFNRFGAICSLDRGAVVAQDKMAKGGHNLLIAGSTAYVNDSLNQRVLAFDLDSGRLVRTLEVKDIPEVRRDARRLGVTHAVKRLLHNAGLLGVQPARPLFQRGLDRAGGRLFVGLSPAMILEIDPQRGALVDTYRHSDDVRVCVHGLKAAPNGQEGA